MSTLGPGVSTSAARRGSRGRRPPVRDSAARIPVGRVVSWRSRRRKSTTPMVRSTTRRCSRVVTVRSTNRALRRGAASATRSAPTRRRPVWPATQRRVRGSGPRSRSVVPRPPRAPAYGRPLTERAKPGDCPESGPTAVASPVHAPSPDHRRGRARGAHRRVHAPAHFPPPVGPDAGLGHTGRWFTDAHGRVVNLRGVNFVQKFPPISPAAAGFGDDDAEFLHDQGFNVVRLGVVFGAVMPEPGVIDHAYVDSIASTVRVLAREHIFMLLDFHQDGYGPLVHGNGFPDWATLTDGLPNPPDPFPTYYLTEPGVAARVRQLLGQQPGPDGVPLQPHYAAAVTVGRDRGRRRGLRARLRPHQRAVARRRFDTCLVPGCPDIEAARLVPFGRADDRRDPFGRRAHFVFSEPFTLFNFGLADTSLSGIGAPSPVCRSTSTQGRRPTTQRSWTRRSRHRRVATRSSRPSSERPPTPRRSAA